MQQSAQNNLFTAFNNIEKIKEERKVKPVIRVEEMIKAIREHYNLNAPMLANNLGVDAQTVYKWERGSKPNIKRYNKIKELYEGITRENKTEVLEQPKSALKPLEIANKEVREDVTAGTPFIEVTSDFNDKKIYLNVYKIREISVSSNGTHIYSDGNTIIKETPAEVLELIREKLKEDEKN